MPQKSIYFDDELLEWLDAKSGADSRASIVRKAAQYYRHHEEAVDSWELPPDPDAGRCEYCGGQFANEHGVMIHQRSCEEAPGEPLKPPKGEKI